LFLLAFFLGTLHLLLPVRLLFVLLPGDTFQDFGLHIALVHFAEVHCFIRVDV